MIDQSCDERTSIAVDDWRADPRFRYIHTPTTGLSRSRNIAMIENRSRMLAFTDDDCEPSADWLRSFVDVLQRGEGPAMAFSPVVQAGSGQSAADSVGLAAVWRPSIGRCRRSAWREPCLGGIGASMALTASAMGRVGAFESLLGRGAPTVGGEECDYAFRVVDSGGVVVEMTVGGVTHHGIVPHEALHDAMRADLMSVGRALGSRARQRRLAAFAQLCHVVARTAPRESLRNLIRTGRPRGLNRQVWVIQGFVVAMVRGLPQTSRRA